MCAGAGIANQMMIMKSSYESRADEHTPEMNGSLHRNTNEVMAPALFPYTFDNICTLKGFCRNILPAQNRLFVDFLALLFQLENCFIIDWHFQNKKPES